MKKESVSLSRKFIFGIFSLILIMSIFSVSIFAQEATDTTTGTTADLAETIEFVDHGTTPDSFFYNFERFYETIQLNIFTFSAEDKAELEAQFTAERISEINAMIEIGDYDSALEAAVDANQILNNAEGHIESIVEDETVDLIQIQEGQVDGTTLHNLIDLQEEYLHDEQHIDGLKEVLQQEVEEGTVTSEQAGTLINELQEGLAGVQTDISESKEELVEASAEESGISIIEADIIVEEEETEAGVTEEFKKEVAIEEIDTLRLAIADITNEAELAEEAGELDNAEVLHNLLENAELKLQVCEQALEEGDYGEAHGQFTAAEHLTLNADKYLSDHDSVDIELITEDYDEIRKDFEEEHDKYVSDYETHRDELLGKYPERADEINKAYERSKKIGDLTERVGNELTKLFNDLKAEGKTEAEVIETVHARFVDEFKKAYGEDYIPPGFINFEETEEDLHIIPIGRIDDFGDVKYGGGFIEGQEYTDPISGYKYTYTKEGCTYTTPLGEIYEFEYPKAYEPVEYVRGDEVHEYKYHSPEGTYEYTYFATGYQVIGPDGVVGSFIYPEGTHEVVGGGEINNKPTGFEYKSDEGKAINYEYNPEFEHYVASDGKVYVPSASYHLENSEYHDDKNTYSHTYQGETWNYNPESGKWISSSGETHTPEAITGAPVGHEDKGYYTTEHGETWSYDSSTGSWTSSTGSSYTPPPSSYYSYDPEAHHYTDVHGQIHEGVDSGSFYDTGKSWAYDSSSGVWSSSTGDTYNPYTGSGTSGTGETTDYSTGGYHTAYSSGSYTDTSGATWTQGSDGSWTSSTGSSYTTGTGDASYSGSYSGSYSPPTDGSYSGTYSGTYDSGSYTGGHTDSG
ncbi:MAG: DUF5667 domain-containing protein, partial [Nanoarchaeota archaeon]